MFWEILRLMFFGFLVAELASLMTTAYLHRSSTHGAVIYNSAVEFIMQFISWLTTGINRKEWVAIHLCHHAHADQDGDPHSPIILGLWKVQLGNLFLYRKAAKNPEVLWYGRHIKPTLAERTIFKWPALGLALGISIACLTMGWWQGLILAGAHAILYLFVLNNLVNGWCHVYGYKNFNTVAFNNRWVAWLTMGEGLHNNHHWKPGRAKLSTRLSEFDLGWFFIKTLSLFGLARISYSK